jgi:PAS domain S-box-containing protein
MNDPLKKQLRVLIIDDDEVDRIVVHRSLRKIQTDIEVVMAASIDEGYARFRDGQYDCIFIDYRLPGGNGLELLQDFRAKGLEAPMIVMTSHGDEKIAVEVMKSGGTDYIQKKMLESDALAQVLRSALRAGQAAEDQRVTAKALADSQARLYEAQRIANIGSWEVNLETGERYWSDQMYRILGYFEPLESLPNIDLFLKHIHPTHMERVNKVFSQCVKEGTPIKFDMEVLTLEGESRHVEAHGRAIRNSSGRTLAVTGTLQDITHRKETERALIDARDRAEKLTKAKEEFLANMSHEIRTPMNAIIGFSKLLYATPMNKEQLEYLAAIDNSGKTLIAIINDILDLSKVESGKLEFEHHSFSLAALLSALSGMFSPRADEKQLKLTTHMNTDVPDRVCGDPVRLNQILINLVGNALKFTEEGMVKVTVSNLGSIGKNVKLLFEVSDTGIGIAAGKQEAIFESFTQASSDTTRKYGGSGLGLTISKRLVELQQGSIGVKSTLGQGSTFFFELPFSPCKTTPPSGFEGQKILAPLNTSAVQAHVLIAEDILLNQRLASRILELGGHSYKVANNGKEALAALDLEPFDLVLMDIQMPEMDGYAATRAIRNNPDKTISQLPIIALTAHAMPEQLSSMRAAGFNDCLSKPFQPEELLAMVQRLISPSMANPKAGVLNLKDLDALTAGDAETRQELIGIFVDDIPKSLGKMRSALANGDGKALHAVAHGCKPSFLLFNVAGAKEILELLEDCQEGQPSPEILGRKLAELEALAEAAISELKKTNT